MSRNGRAALAYSRLLGWLTLPLWPRNKHPLGDLVPHGVHEATLDAETISMWWHVCPDANVGLAAGDWIGLDEDPRNGGDDTRAELEARFGGIPHTPRQLTGGHGYHYIMRAPPGLRWRPAIGPGLEIKACGGYIVGSPSIHPNGREYVWEAGAHPLETEIADAPGWLIEIGTVPQVRAGRATGRAADSFIARCFAAAGWLGSAVDDLRVAARCPWLISHTPDRHGHRRGDGHDSSTVIFAPSIQSPLGMFHCSHGHCATRRTSDVLAQVPPDAVREIARSMPNEFCLALDVMRRFRHAA